MSAMNSWLNHLLYTLLPGACIICKAATHRYLDICAGCQRSLPYCRHPCWQCGLEMDQLLDVCPACALCPPAYSHCFGLLRYEPPVNVLISQFKTQHRLAIGRVLSVLLARAYLKQHMITPDCWIPVPLHRQAARRRGFNQATEIAQVLTEITGIPTLAKAARRVRQSESQKQLHIDERRTNIKGVFQIDQRLDGMAVGVVDDVVTTGSTVSEMTEQLLFAGAIDVQVVCLARTPEK